MTAAAARSSRRRKIFVAIVVLALTLLAEGLARLGYRAIYHEPYRPSELRQLASGTFEPVGATPDFLARLVLHPYLGFAIDAEGDDRLGLGFGKQDPPLDSVQHAGDLRLLMLGGSVALQLMSPDPANGQSFLGNAISDAFGRAGIRRKLWTFNAALPGFKQPQQLMAYSYLLSQGAQFDLVVNVDGFNEMTLAVIEQGPGGLHPGFPRGWDVMVRQRWTPARLRQAAELLVLRGQQAAWIDLAESKPWARSATVGLYLARRIVDAEARARLLIEEIERKRQQNGLSFEEGGIPFDYGQAEQTCDYLAKLWSRSSRQLAALATANGARYLHVFQPNQYLEGSKPLTDQERREFYRPDLDFGPAYRAAYPCFQREMEELARDGEWLFDASMAFEHEPQTVYSDWCCHFNEYGLRQLATRVADEIVARFRD